MVRAAMPRGTKTSPPCMRPVCRRCGTLRGRLAHATLFSGTRPRCRTRQEWKYTGTRDGRLTRRSALAGFCMPEMRPCGRDAHYRDTLPDVTPFAAAAENRARPGFGPPGARWAIFRLTDVGHHRAARTSRRLGSDRRNVARQACPPFDCTGTAARLVAFASIAWRTKMPESA